MIKKTHQKKYQLYLFLKKRKPNQLIYKAEP